MTRVAGLMNHKLREVAVDEVWSLLPTSMQVLACLSGPETKPNSPLCFMVS